jgi:hypothetical protein
MECEECKECECKECKECECKECKECEFKECKVGENYEKKGISDTDRVSHPLPLVHIVCPSL